MEYDASALGTRRSVVLGVLFVTLQNELTKKHTFYFICM